MGPPDGVTVRRGRAKSRLILTLGETGPAPLLLAACAVSVSASSGRMTSAVHPLTCARGSATVAAKVVAPAVTVTASVPLTTSTRAIPLTRIRLVSMNDPSDGAIIVVTGG